MAIEIRWSPLARAEQLDQEELAAQDLLVQLAEVVDDDLHHRGLRERLDRRATRDQSASSSAPSGLSTTTSDP
jgi:hypothetical protein